MSKPLEQRILIVSSTGASALAEMLGSHFELRLLSDPAQVKGESAQDFGAVLIDAHDGKFDCQTACRQVKGEAGFADVPIILAQPKSEMTGLLALYDAGYDDVMIEPMETADLVARIQKAIFHRIANRQLHSRLMQANALAMSAMSDTSDLGVNIQFLVHCHECNNLDELGMLLFRTLTHYGINCSLQLRSEFETKNLEENGLAKDLEARLLSELSTSGRYVDFGRRCVMNYERVSLLVKNMPSDEKRFGTIKDNVFSLLQGANARVQSIDGARMLELERDLLRGMSHRMQDVMRQVDERYQSVMSRCAATVEDMAMKIEQSILFLDLTEPQEETLTRITHAGISGISSLFNDGIRIDASFRKLLDYLNTGFSMEGGRSPEELRKLLDRL
ncbi:MAG TPA: hypothetical protein VM553_08135 [Dongiaceae bacterium]|nr:hypothetical protein [Dongiaceae bacterium]